MSTAIDNANPFYFEIDVDDEICFKTDDISIVQKDHSSPSPKRTPLGNRNLNIPNPSPLDSQLGKRSPTPSPVPKSECVPSPSPTDRLTTPEIKAIQRGDDTRASPRLEISDDEPKFKQPCFIMDGEEGEEDDDELVPKCTSVDSVNDVEGDLEIPESCAIPVCESECENMHMPTPAKYIHSPAVPKSLAPMESFVFGTPPATPKSTAKKVVVESVIEESVKEVETTVPYSNAVKIEGLSSMEYNSSLHLPKYSEAELESMLESAAQRLTNKHDAELERVQEEARMKADAVQTMHKVEMLQKKEVEDKYKAIEVENGGIVEEFALLKIQNKALSHRLQTIDAEQTAARKLHQQESEKGEALHKLQLDQLQRENAEKFEEWKFSENEKHSAVVQQMEKQLEDLRQKSEEHNNILKLNEEKWKKDTLEAVNAAKKHVYAKAEAQFVSGNAKFQAVKTQLKESEAEVVALKEKLTTSDKFLKQAQDECAEMASELAAIKVMKATDRSYVISFLQAMGDDTITSDTTPTPQNVEKVAMQIKEMVQSQASITEQLSAITALNTDVQKQLDEKMLSETALSADIVLLQGKYDGQQIVIATLRKEQETLQSELNEHMNAMAILSTSSDKVNLEKAALQEEVTVATERCGRLTAMNEELMGMLENMDA